MQQVVRAEHTGLIGSQPPRSPLADVSETKIASRGKGFPVGWLIAPATLWLFIFLVIPLAGIIVFSFFQSTRSGMVADLTLQYYGEYFISEGFFDPSSGKFLTPSVFMKTLGSTIFFAGEVMLFSLILGYPIAYFLAMVVRSFQWKMALFLLCMVPFWTSYLIRAVAWLPMLGRRGLINNLLVSTGIIDKPISLFLYSEFAYTMALVQLYVVLCIGPMFFSLAKIDRSVLEAARDLGATPFQIFREIILPLSLPGVAIGMIFIFVLLMGEFATAVVVYGGKIGTAGTVILSYYGTANYPFASVNALMLMISMMIGVVIILRIVNIRKEL